MDININSKIIIIGAGPAGLSTALNLYERGLKNILVIERFSFPRYKCCAGYVTSKTKQTYKRLGLDIDNCHYTLIKDFNILYHLKIKLNITNKFLYTNDKIDRVELDNALFELTVSKGIEIKQNSVILSHTAEKCLLTLNDGTTLNYDYLVFADGTTGFGSKYQRTIRQNIALQLTYPTTMTDKIDIHFGITPKGYGWVSCYNGTCNVGITDVFRPKIDYKKVFKDYIAKLGINADLSDLKGAFTPIGIRKPILYNNVYFVGDAVGACDPLTLSGLRYALNCGTICAQAIYTNKPATYKRYISKLKCKFGVTRYLQKIFYLKTSLFTIFNVICRFFGKFVSRVFNNYFVNKK